MPGKTPAWKRSSALPTPYVSAHERIEDCIERLKEYAEDSIPVLNEKKRLIGIITAQDIVEAVDDEMGDDYAKLGGLTAEEDLNESLLVSVKKRLPWLIILLFLGMVVSTVVGLFEGVVAHVALLVCFQSLILDMAGNVGTQSLAVTIRVLMDESLTARQKLELVWKEMRIGLCNGGLLGVLAGDPRPRYQEDPQRVYGMGFAGQNVRFTVAGDTLTVRSIDPLEK